MIETSIVKQTYEGAHELAVAGRGAAISPNLVQVPTSIFTRSP